MESIENKSGNVSKKDIIGIYEWLLKTGKIKEGGAGHQRLKDLKHKLTRLVWR